VAVQQGRSVIVVTHDSRVVAYGDRTIEMADGRITRVTQRRAGDAESMDEEQDEGVLDREAVA